MRKYIPCFSFEFRDWTMFYIPSYGIIFNFMLYLIVLCLNAENNSYVYLLSVISETILVITVPVDGFTQLGMIPCAGRVMTTYLAIFSFDVLLIICNFIYFLWRLVEILQISQTDLVKSNNTSRVNKVGERTDLKGYQTHCMPCNVRLIMWIARKYGGNTDICGNVFYITKNLSHQ